MTSIKLPKHRLDLTGQKFGMWTVDKPAQNANGMTRWHCTCDCGVKKVVLTLSLRQGKSQSCGCLAAELSSRRMLKWREEHLNSNIVSGETNA